MTTLEARPVRDLAIALPGATAIFRRHKIDFCCHGGVPLQEAAQARGVDLSVLVAELEGLAVTELSPVLEPQPLIEHILERYHAVHRREFPEAIRMARRVEAVHREAEACPYGLADHLSLMADDLEDHQQKEEAVLFPAMLSGGGPMLRFPIARMMAEHVEVGAQLETLARLTTDFEPPEGACTTWRALYAACAKLDADLREHMHLENKVLFPMFVAPS